jgi:hypothetical protein
LQAGYTPGRLSPRPWILADPGRDPARLLAAEPGREPGRELALPGLLVLIFRRDNAG